MGLNYTIWGSPKAWNPLWWNNQDTLPPYTWIGFEGASPWMCDEMAPGYIFRYWLVFFYYYALYGNTGDYSVMEALNLASQACGFSNFESSVLRTGYNVFWPYPPEGPSWDNPGKMHVLGRPSATCLPADYHLHY